MKPAIILATLALLGSAARAEDWADNKDYAGDPAYAPSIALCRKVRDREPPQSDRPSAAMARALKGCSSEALYYGIGRPADPVRARQCAFVEQDADDGGVFAGDTLLMTIYANGRGARQDLDLAIHYACNIDSAPAEYGGRIDHLAALKTKPAAEPFDFCNDITSGLAGGYCASHDAAVAGAKRAAKLAALIAGWTPAERAAFVPLQKAQAAYVEAHGGKEIDMSGTARAALEIGAEEEVRDDFLAMLTQLSTGKAPVFTATQYKAQDARLNAAYLAIQRGSGEDLGTVTKADIKAAQRVWLSYRDAFIAFAKIKWPAVSGDSIAGWITQTRVKAMSGED